MFKNFRVAKFLVVKMSAIPLTMSWLISSSILHTDNVNISEALRDRANDVLSDDDLVTVRLGVTITEQVNQRLAELAKMSRLPAEEVVRLSIEAYLKHLNSQEGNYETTGAIQPALIRSDH